MRERWGRKCKGEACRIEGKEKRKGKCPDEREREGAMVAEGQLRWLMVGRKDERERQVRGISEGSRLANGCPRNLVRHWQYGTKGNGSITRRRMGRRHAQDGPFMTSALSSTSENRVAARVKGKTSGRTGQKEKDQQRKKVE